MADNTQSRTQNQKTTYHWPINVTPPSLKDYSKQYPIDDLLKPAIVKITAWDEADDLNAHDKGVVEIPKALLCSRSEYFDRLFNSGLRESHTGEVQLKDVPRWLLRCFVGWVYHQRVYDAVYEPSSSQSKEDGDKPTPITAEDECDPNNPVTWPYNTLFRLYIFGDRYDTKAFRTTVFEIIQMKMLQVKPRRYPPLSVSGLAYAAANLPTSSPLFRLLRDLIAYNLTFDDVDTSSRGPEGVIETEAMELEVLPPAFLAQCLIVSRRASRALTCSKCTHGKDCADRDHTAEERLQPAERKVCSYHEHDDEDEAEQCVLRWSLGLSDRMLRSK